MSAAKLSFLFGLVAMEWQFPPPQVGGRYLEGGNEMDEGDVWSIMKYFLHKIIFEGYGENDL